MIDALSAAAAGGEHRVYKAGKLEGLFPSRSLACTQAAHRALAEGLLERTRLEVKGKTEIEWVRITPAGIQLLHESESPVAALRELRTALHVGQKALPFWLGEIRGSLTELGEKLVAEAERWSARLEGLERRVDDALRRIEASGPLVPPELLAEHPWALDALNYLDRRRALGAPPECPLPELHEAVSRHHAHLSLSAFHDGVRELHERRAIVLRPSEEMPSPEFALLDGAKVYYLAVR